MIAVIEVIIGIIYFVWPFLWILALFLKGYARVQYPGAEKSLNSFDEDQLKKVREKGWRWIVLSLIAIVIWLLIPLFI